MSHAIMRDTEIQNNDEQASQNESSSDKLVNDENTSESQQEM